MSGKIRTKSGIRAKKLGQTAGVTSLCDIGEDDEEVVNPMTRREMKRSAERVSAVGAVTRLSSNEDTAEYCQDCKLNENRLSLARSKSSCVLSDDELRHLTEMQHRIAAGDLEFSRSSIERKATAEEGVRARVDGVHRRMRNAARRARTDGDGAHGTLLSDSDRAERGIVNSLLATDAAFSVVASKRSTQKELAQDAKDAGWDSVSDLLELMDMEEEHKIAEEEEGEDDEGKEAGGREESESSFPKHDALYGRRCSAFIHAADSEDECHFNVEDTHYVRKPNLAKLIERRDLHERSRPKYSLRVLLTSRRFHLYKHRFANAQYQRGLLYPTLPQPREDDEGNVVRRTTPDGKLPTEMTRTRPNGHRFIIAADTQFGILMDGYAMENPNWGLEIEYSRRAVAKINAMSGPDRPLFVCVCGDLVDTESSFSHALASWKKIMAGWERTLVFDQQVKDFKRVWGRLDDDIALVCLCGNHDVGNRPTRTSVERWTSLFGDDYLAFWVNGTYNIALNNCLFSDPTGAPDMFEEQLVWLEGRLRHGRENDATHIFVYSHFPWLL